MNTERAIQLLSQGHPARVVAAALGVTESAISQLVSQESYAKEIAEKRAAALSKYSEMDDKWNRIEDKLLDKLEKVVPMLVRPRDILLALDKVNSAKRRGTFTPQETLPQDRVVSLDLPPSIQYNIITNINQQVVEISSAEGLKQSLVTIPTNQLEGLANENLKRKVIAGGCQESAESESADPSALHHESAEDFSGIL